MSCWEIPETDKLSQQGTSISLNWGFARVIDSCMTNVPYCSHVHLAVSKSIENCASIGVTYLNGTHSDQFETKQELEWRSQVKSLFNPDTFHNIWMRELNKNQHYQGAEVQWGIEWLGCSILGVKQGGKAEGIGIANRLWNADTCWLPCSVLLGWAEKRRHVRHDLIRYN